MGWNHQLEFVCVFFFQGGFGNNFVLQALKWISAVISLLLNTIFKGRLTKKASVCDSFGSTPPPSNSGIFRFP